MLRGQEEGVVVVLVRNLWIRCGCVRRGRLRLRLPWGSGRGGLRSRCLERGVCVGWFVVVVAVERLRVQMQLQGQEQQPQQE